MPRPAHLFLLHVCSYYFKRCPIACTSSFFIEGWYSSFSLTILLRVCLNVILANYTPQRVSIRHFGEWYSAECTATCPKSYNIIMHRQPFFCLLLSWMMQKMKHVFIYANRQSVPIHNFGEWYPPESTAFNPTCILYFGPHLWKGGYTTFWQMIPRRVYLCVIKAIGTPQRVPRLYRI